MNPDQHNTPSAQPSLLTSSDNKLSVLHNALSGIYYRMSADQLDTLQCSEGCADLLGISASDLIRQGGIQSVVHKEDIDLFRSRSVISKNGLQVINYRIADAKGIFHWIKDEFVIILNTQNNPIVIEGHIAASEDPTQSWPLLRHLKAYRDAIDVNIISSITDVEGTIIHANKIFCEVSQYSRQELVGKNHRIVCSGHHTKEFFADLWKTISSGKVWRGEILNRSKKGNLYWVDTVIIPVADESGRTSHYLSLRTLITGRKAAEKQKDEYTRMLEEIAFVVTHRIRGPICSIEGLMNLLEHPSLHEDEKKITLKHLRTSVGELDTITHELSDLLYVKGVDLKKKNYQDQTEE